jgi:hypothetical protein
MNKLTELEIGYVAGLFDGEGTIGYYQGRIAGFSLRVKIVLTDFRPIYWLKEKLGIGFVTYRKRKPPCRDVMEWQAKSRADVKEFLRAIEPYLLIKREQAQLLIEFLSTEGKIPGPVVHEAATKKRKEMLSHRLFIQEKLKELKVPTNLPVN